MKRKAPSQRSELLSGYRTHTKYLEYPAAGSHSGKTMVAKHTTFHEIESNPKQDNANESSRKVRFYSHTDARYYSPSQKEIAKKTKHYNKSNDNGMLVRYVYSIAAPRIGIKMIPSKAHPGTIKPSMESFSRALMTDRVEGVEDTIRELQKDRKKQRKEYRRRQEAQQRANQTQSPTR
ncbi:MAG: hypothetical protein MK137_08695 [Rickettsiales bacterium]|nr:hypothetical protein [Rickettsiales bacterium]